MKKLIKKLFPVLVISMVFVLTGCQNVSVKGSAENQPKDEGNKNQIANPASENCIKNGGMLEIRKSKKGEYGVCMFEDNRQCEEWALLRGDCPKGGLKVTGYQSEAEVFCAISGGELEGLDTDTPMCKRIDGTLCNAQANFDGECPDPSDPNPNAGNSEAP